MSYLYQINKKNIIVAKNFFAKLRGLYFRNPKFLCLIENCNSIHTMFFTSEIDVAFVRNKKVIKVIRNLKP